MRGFRQTAGARRGQRSATGRDGCAGWDGPPPASAGLIAHQREADRGGQPTACRTRRRLEESPGQIAARQPSGGGCRSRHRCRGRVSERTSGRGSALGLWPWLRTGSACRCTPGRGVLIRTPRAVPVHLLDPRRGIQTARSAIRPGRSDADVFGPGRGRRRRAGHAGPVGLSSQPPDQRTVSPPVQRACSERHRLLRTRQFSLVSHSARVPS